MCKNISVFLGQSRGDEQIKGNRSNGVVYILWYFKHLNLCHRTERKQLKRKEDLS